MHRFVVMLFVVASSIALLHADGLRYLRTGDQLVIDEGSPTYFFVAGSSADRVIIWSIESNNYNLPNWRFGRLAEDLSVFSQDLPYVDHWVLAVAVGPDRALLALWDFADYSLKGVILDLEGNVLAEKQIAENASDVAAAAWDGEAFTIVWSIDSQMYLARLDTDGQLVSEPAYLIDAVEPPEGYAARQHEPHLQRLGDDLLLVWQEGGPFFFCHITCPTPDMPGIIRMGLIRDGSFVESSLQRVDSESPWTGRSNAYFAPSVHVGDSIAISWFEQMGRNQETADLHLRLFGPDLSEQERLLVPNATIFDSPPRSSVASLGDRILVAFEAPDATLPSNPYVRDIVFFEANTDGTFDAGTLRSTFNDDASPWLFGDGSGFVLVLVENRYEPDSRIVIERYERFTPLPRRRGVRR